MLSSTIYRLSFFLISALHTMSYTMMPENAIVIHEFSKQQEELIALVNRYKEMPHRALSKKKAIV